VGGVEAITDLANMYPAGGIVIVTEILAHPGAGRQPLKATCEMNLSGMFQN
jgi:hypothetical protein